MHVIWQGGGWGRWGVRGEWGKWGVMGVMWDGVSVCVCGGGGISGMGKWGVMGGKVGRVSGTGK